MEQQPNYYAVIPATVRYAKISANAKLLYSEITALTNKQGYCWATNAYFAKLYDVHKNTVSKWVSELANAGLIKVEMLEENKNGSLYTKRQIRINENVEGGINENVYHNNTSNNNTSNTVSKDTGLKAYGNKQVNELLQVFKDEYNVKPPPNDRNYASNLIKGYGSKLDVVGLAKMIIEAGKHDEFAPHITCAKDMYYKMSKISKYVKDSNRKGAYHV